tara:strand:- start:595 stop:957 length:363 start_codon:yes stop_codon:yes gene_type:complete
MKRKAGKVSASINIKRSKDEIELFDLCNSVIDNCLSNHVIVDGWDADIVLCDQKIAILWNGPWHYKEMNMSNHSLSQVRTRDRIKRKQLRSHGWKVIIFEDRYFTPSTAFAAIRKLVGAT